MSGTNMLRRPLGNNVPLPGGDPIDTPQARGPQPPASPPPSGGVGDAPSPMSFDSSQRTLMEEHNRNKAIVTQTEKALKKLDAIRKSLTHLASKQDIVTMEDIVGEAGKLVSHGLDPVALAGVLADAPQEGGGEALGAWVASHAQTAVQAEQQMSQQYRMALHDMGQSATHLLMAHSNQRAMMGDIMPGEDASQNPLVPGATESEPPPSAGQGPAHMQRMQNSLTMPESV